MKRQKTGSTNEHVQSLERVVLAAIQEGSSLNLLSDLMALISSSPDPQTTHSLIYAVYRIMVALAQAGKLTPERDEREEARIVRQWLDARVATFSELLAGLLKDDEKALRVSLPYLLFDQKLPLFFLLLLRWGHSRSYYP